MSDLAAVHNQDLWARTISHIVPKQAFSYAAPLALVSAELGISPEDVVAIFANQYGRLTVGRWSVKYIANRKWVIFDRFRIPVAPPQRLTAEPEATFDPVQVGNRARAYREAQRRSGLPEPSATDAVRYVLEQKGWNPGNQSGIARER